MSRVDAGAAAAIRPRRVALVHRFFHPDVTSYAQMLDRYAAHLADLGHDVTVICGPPTYNSAYAGPDVSRHEHRGGFEIRRLRVPSWAGRVGKAIDYALFPVLVAAHLISRRRAYDVVSVTTIPPVVMGLAARISRLRSRRTQVVYHCMDLYPEVAAALGLRPDGIVARIARRIDNATIGVATRTIVLSEDMRRTVQARGGPTDRVAVCNNFILQGATEAVPSTRDRSAGRRRFIFAGNLGHFQGLDTLVEAFVAAHERGVRADLVFLGAGPMKGWIESEAARTGAPIEVWEHRPLREAMGLMQTADVGIVSLGPDVAGFAFPSKLMIYLELGLPILTVVEAHTELAGLIRDHDLGWVAEPDDVDDIATAIGRGSADPLPDPSLVQKTGREWFAPDHIMATWTHLYGLDMPA